ncbi:hypothetical protein [Terrarubrum flagellatum]|uniref:hypothetical protein n=1 Tax=Terrirubrum flagellatum TaxID=2895980 RepID=UPI0031454ECB
MKSLIRDSGVEFTPEDLAIMQSAFDRACRGLDISEAERREAALAIFEAFRHGARDIKVLAEIGRVALPSEAA